MITIIILLFLSLLFHLIDSQCSLCTMPNGQCTTNGIQGILCEECNYRGYVDPVTRTCACNSRFENPSVNCSSLYSVPIIVNVTTVVTNYHCDCHHNTEDGDWKLNEPPFESRIFINSSDFKEFKYGLPYPPVCNTCFNMYIGPPPESLTPSMTSFKVQACTRIGGMDPNVVYRYKDITQGPDSPYIQVDYESFVFYPRNLDVEEDEPVFTWYECSNHGVWDPILHVCVCNKGWGLALLPEKGFGGKDLYTCEVCAGPYGYKVPSQQYIVQKGNDFCAAPFTPDPVDGGTKICSGHGDFQLGECRCYDNSTHGHWTLANYTTQELTVLGVGDMTYEEVDVTYTVLTCLECKPPYSPDSFCMDATDSPSHSPTQTPTTKEPTRPPTRGPTLAPTTPIPTLEPTKQPTDSPTRPPSKGPTKDPTPLPSRLPTIDPTYSPTHDPTNNPSKSPSSSPTKNPTSSPTTDPTRPPSINPTHSPTNSPSHEPTRSPSKPPSTSPTRPPSTHPSRNPSLSPTNEPTRLPTELPSRSPTSSPTGSPSKAPTKAPTDGPTLAPTSSPTQPPTLVPTFSPTLSTGVLRVFAMTRGDGAWGDTTTADAQCQAFIDTQGLAYRQAVAFRSDPGDGSRYIKNFATTFMFPTAAPIRAGNTDIDLGLWGDAIPTFPAGSILISLIDAGVMPNDPDPSQNKWWSGGSSQFISGANTCQGWTSSLNADFGQIGRGANTDIGWIDDQNDRCDNQFWRFCLVIQGTATPTSVPTQSPTKTPTLSPTPPTSSPSKSPSTSPTKSPTKVPTLAPTTPIPTKAPTKDPTRPPTNNPTRDPTRNPTNAPSRDPTRPPTNNPTQTPTTAQPTQPPTTKSPSKAPTQGPTTITNVIIYANYQNVNGNLGTRSQTNAYCTGSPVPAPSSLSALPAVTVPPVCAAGTQRLLVSYSPTDELRTLFPTPSSVYGAKQTSPTTWDYTRLSPTWTSMFAPDASSVFSSVFSLTPYVAIPYAIGQPIYAIWTGSFQDGTVSDTCSGWTSSLNAGRGIRGFPNVMGAGWARSINSASIPCDNNSICGVVCGCGTYGDPSTPTQGPTTRPTTPVPTVNPASSYLLLFPGQSGQLNYASSRNYADGRCAKYAEYLGISSQLQLSEIRGLVSLSPTDNVYDLYPSPTPFEVYSWKDGSILSLNPTVRTWSRSPQPSPTGAIFSPVSPTIPAAFPIIAPTPTETFITKNIVANNFRSDLINYNMMFTGSNPDGTFVQVPSPTPTTGLTCNNYNDFTTSYLVPRGAYAGATSDFWRVPTPTPNPTRACSDTFTFGCVAKINTDIPSVPTQNPTTAAPADTIWVYSDPAISTNGNIGSRVQSDELCANLYFVLYTSNNPFPIPITSKWKLLASYSSTDQMVDLNTALNQPSSAPVRSLLTGTVISPTWSGMFSNTPTSLSVSLFTAGVIPYNTPTLWYTGSSATGQNPAPSPVPTCTGWSVNTASPTVGTYGDLTSTSGTAISAGTIGCNIPARWACVTSN